MPQCFEVVSENAGGVEGCPQCFVVVSDNAGGVEWHPSVL